jgi:hypothetical protein
MGPTVPDLIAELLEQFLFWILRHQMSSVFCTVQVSSTDAVSGTLSRATHVASAWCPAPNTLHVLAYNSAPRQDHTRHSTGVPCEERK